NVRAQGAMITVECDKRLIPLFSRSFPGITYVEMGDPHCFIMNRKTFDYHAIVCRLARHFRPGLPGFPSRPSYLRADMGKRTRLRQRYLAGRGGVKLVGIAWHSKKSINFGHKKSLRLLDFLPVLEREGVVFVDLQYGDTLGERLAFTAETGIPILHDDSIDQMVDLDSFAAQVAAMDVVVTISNTTAHMAGALGVPTLLILEDVPSLWFWGITGERSPWYPAMRLFRAHKRGEWEEVLLRVAEALTAGLDAGAGS
ncbi:MAG: hypothetical protein HQL88_11265, partial [Magnetococcales bacterium]|nr:hypothetical protein [Magnetococcales bacterium]